MAKLFASAIVGALAMGNAAASSQASPLQMSPLLKPLATHHNHPPSIPQARKDQEQQQQQQSRTQKQGHPQRVLRDAVAPEGCPGTAYLWKITDDNAENKHVGFAFGTMHLPVDIVTTEAAYDSVMEAIIDSCDVYGELNMNNRNVSTAVQSCLQEISANAATPNDLPSEELRNAIRAKLVSIAADVPGEGNENGALAETYADRWMGLALKEVVDLIMYANTPVYREKYLPSFISGVGTLPQDTHLMALGRPGGDLEEVSTQCELLKPSYPSVEDVTQNADLYSASIAESLDVSFTETIDLYTCGDIDAFVTQFDAGMSAAGFDSNVLLDQRNIQMAEAINDILNASPDERILFAVGLSHWIIGPQNLEILLKEYGYSLERVPNWSADDAEDHTNPHCKVLFSPEMGFVPDPDGLFAPGPSPAGITSEPSHSVVRETYFTLPPSPANDTNYTNELVQISNAPTSMAPTITATPTAKATKSPTRMPTGGEAGEGVQPSGGAGTPAVDAKEPSSGAMIDISKMVFVGAFVCLLRCMS